MNKEEEISKEAIEAGVKALFGSSGGGERISSSSVDELDSAAEVDNIKKVEAALFIAGKFLSLQELITLTDVNPILLRKILGDVEEKYKDSGIEIVKNGDMWKMDVASEHREMVNKLASGQSEFSKAEQETLAIIAHKQPMKQSILVKIRGNKAYDHVKSFVQMGLITKKRIGHTAELNLSDEFYDYFHLENPKNSPAHSNPLRGF